MKKKLGWHKILIVSLSIVNFKKTSQNIGFSHIIYLKQQAKYNQSQLRDYILKIKILKIITY